jgi:translation initiation factor IF-3
VTQGGHISTEPRINERIRVPEVRLVGPNGEQVGIVAINDALRLAQEADLDLVEVAPMARPPVCKLMDYGKFKYESALKARESRKNQAQTVIKEIKLRPKIDPHDYGTKKGHVERFLKQGDKVKVTIMFRGREQSRPELGFKLLQRLAGDIEELGFVESSPKQDGRNMIMVIGPHKRKTEAVAAARAERASRSDARRAGLDHDLDLSEIEAIEPVEDAQAEAATTDAPGSRDAQADEAAAQPDGAKGPQAEAVTAEPAGAKGPQAEAVTAQPGGAKGPQAEAVTAEPAGAKGPQAEATPRSAPSRPATPRPAAPRPPAPKPAAGTQSPAGAPRPTAPRATPATARPAAPSGSGTPAPRPTAPRGATTASRTTGAKPAPPRRAADAPVPAPRTVAADKGAKANGDQGEADS